MLTFDTFVGSLATATDVNAHYALIRDLARRGQVETLGQLFGEIQSRYPLEHSHWAPCAALDQIVETLTLADGYENAWTALELHKLLVAPIAGRARRLDPAAVASRLVAAQSATVIDELLRHVPEIETRALLLHEAVARGKLIRESSAGQQIAAMLREAGHPLAFLPLELSDVEDRLFLPTYGPQSIATALPFGPTPKQAETFVRVSQSSPEYRETTATSRTAKIAAVVENWVAESNGIFEVRTFWINQLPHGEIATLLFQVGLESIGQAESIHVQRDRGLQEAFTHLFAAAANGGAYNRGRYAAYGRLLAWKSLSGLAGCPENACFEEVKHAIKDCQWLLFDPDSTWFHRIAWDLGIACWNPQHNELAILAATDTD